MTDKYRQVWGYPGYGVSADGEVINLETNRVLEHHRTRTGHIFVSLRYAPGKRRARSLGRIVAECYIDPPKDIRDNTIIHLDYDIENNRADNLLWRNRWFAAQYHKQYRSMFYPLIREPFVLLETGEIFQNSHDFCTTKGALDLDVAASLLTKTQLLYPRCSLLELKKS